MKKSSFQLTGLRYPFFVVLFLLPILLSSCFHNYYKIIEKNPPTLMDFKAIGSPNKFLVLCNNGLLWNISNVKIDDRFLSGTASEIYPERYDFIDLKRNQSNRYRHNQSIDQSYIINEIHVYVDEPLAVRDSVKIPIELIRKMEIFDKNKPATTGSWIIGSLGIAIMAVIVATTVFSSDFML